MKDISTFSIISIKEVIVYEVDKLRLWQSNADEMSWAKYWGVLLRHLTHTTNSGHKTFYNFYIILLPLIILPLIYLFFAASLTCTASGDPHYRTFDGRMTHYQGVCRYILVAVVPGANVPNWFTVLVENEHRNGKTSVSYTKAVIVLLRGIVIRLDKRGLVSVSTPI